LSTFYGPFALTIPTFNTSKTTVGVKKSLRTVLGTFSLRKNTFELIALRSYFYRTYAVLIS